MNLLEQANRTPVTFVVLLAYLTFAFVVDVQSAERGLVHYGACVPMLVQAGEPWRLLTYAVLHGGLLHLFFNSYCLLMLGPGLESMLGSARFTVLYVVTALGGSVAGCLWHEPYAPLVGGSGALFGMMGAAIAMLMRQGRHPLDFLNYAGPRQLVMLVVLNLAIGFLFPFISNAAHIGGLVTGFACTFCFFGYRRDPADATSRAIQGGWVALAASLVLYVCKPVLRWDYLADRIDAAQEAHDRQAAGDYARAFLKATRDFKDLPPGAIKPEGLQLVRDLARED